jgi:GNAT superfamily N-acetyltransferase
VGFEVTEVESVLVGSASALPVEAVGTSFDVRPVTPEQTAAWAFTHREAFELPAISTREAMALDGTLIAHPDVVCYLAWCGDEPVGGGALLLSGGVATFFATGTRPGFRGRGVHRALLAARLSRAAALGADVVTMAVVPGSASQRNLERCGFNVAYASTILRKQSSLPS